MSNNYGPRSLPLLRATSTIACTHATRSGERSHRPPPSSSKPFFKAFFDSSSFLTPSLRIAPWCPLQGALFPASFAAAHHHNKDASADQHSSSDHARGSCDSVRRFIHTHTLNCHSSQQLRVKRYTDVETSTSLPHRVDIRQRLPLYTPPRSLSSSAVPC